MLFFSSLFLNIFDFGAGAVIFGVQNYQLAGLVAPFWHPMVCWLVGFLLFFILVLPNLYYELCAGSLDSGCFFQFI
jgi:hypothetical protein